MAYVDIGWAAGLALLGANVLLRASVGYSPRCVLMGGALVLHGGRMLLARRRRSSTVVIHSCMCSSPTSLYR